MLLQGFWHGYSTAYCSWQALFISINCSAGNFSSVFTSYQKQCAIFGWDHNMFYIHLASIPIGCHTAELAIPLQSTQAKHTLGSENSCSSGRGSAGSLLSFTVTHRRLFWTSEITNTQTAYKMTWVRLSGISSIPSAWSVNITLYLKDRHRCSFSNKFSFHFHP